VYRCDPMRVSREVRDSVVTSAARPYREQLSLFGTLRVPACMQYEHRIFNLEGGVRPGGSTKSIVDKSAP
jgi:hypothetical protein